MEHKSEFPDGLNWQKKRVGTGSQLNRVVGSSKKSGMLYGRVGDDTMPEE